MRFPTLAAWLEWQAGLHPKSIDLGLDRVRAVWQRLGAPSLGAAVISVAGTNGKGSSVAFLEAMLHLERRPAHPVLLVVADEPLPVNLARRQRNFELLVEVTDTEDFATAAGIQRGYHSPAQSHVVFGRNEPALQHFHRSIDAVVDRHR